MTLIDEVITAAQSEKRAGLTKKDAEQVWRRSWWKLSLALAAVPDGPDLKTAYDAAESWLGCSRSYLAARRKTGKVVASLALLDTVKEQFPPRIAMAWVCDLKRDFEGMAEAMEQAKEDDLSMRGFIEAHGGVPMSTGKERFQPTPDPAGPIHPAPVTSHERQAAARALLDSLDEDELDELVVTSPKTASAFVRAAARQGDTQRRDSNPDHAQPGDDFAEYLLSVKLGIKRRLGSVTTRDDFPEGLRGGVLAQITQIESALGWTRSWAEGSGLMDDLATFLAEEAS